MSIENQNQSMVTKAATKLSSDDGKTVTVSFTKNNKIIQYDPDNTANYIAALQWYIPESEALAKGFGTKVYIDKDNKSLKIKINDSTAAELPLLSGDTNQMLKIKTSDGEVYSLEVSDVDGKHSYKNAIHIGDDNKEYVVCSTCRVQCNMGCSMDSVSELQNACSVYAVCTTNCLGYCSTTCTSNSSQITRFLDWGMTGYDKPCYKLQKEFGITIPIPCFCRSGINWCWWGSTGPLIGTDGEWCLHFCIYMCMYFFAAPFSRIGEIWALCAQGCGRSCDVTCVNGGFEDYKGEHHDGGANDQHLHPANDEANPNNHDPSLDGLTNNEFAGHYFIGAKYIENIVATDKTEKVTRTPVYKNRGKKPRTIIEGSCRNACDGTCYRWCNLNCNTSCIDDNGCLYFAESSLFDIDTEDGKQLLSFSKQADSSKCLWCKTSYLLFPL